ncbi:MAG TPA: DUF3592 domain-containing protein [Chitinophagaceae bacterium]|nr:DUF3592 domain-containing protein [Chitinophagaceae bacterium]
MNAWLITVIGAAIIIAAYIRSRRYDRLLKTGKEAEGVVFDFENSRNADGDISSYPVVRFVTDKRQWITKTADVSISYLKQGDKLSVIYNPLNPGDFTIKSTTVAIFPVILAITGALLLVGGAIAILFPGLFNK